ncbi:glycoside hydrolase family 92 protein [Atractiella rhizophila]|nr:glycoside hydrolase family 92 protein [Atractiella rhizophila]
MFCSKSTLFLAFLRQISSQVVDYTQYVDIRIGTTGGGNDFPGASVPFGMVKVGPDCLGTSSSTAGWNSGGNVTAFSMMHEHGTGGTPKYGVVAQMPYVGTLSSINLADNRTYSQARSFEGFSVSRYNTVLKSGVNVTATTTRRVALLRYQFPEQGVANVIVDVAHFIPALSGEYALFPETYEGGEISVSEDGMSYWGSGSYAGSWNRSPKWTIYFCANFSVPSNASTYTWPYQGLSHPPPSSSPPLSTSLHQVGGNDTGVGAVFTFAAPGVLVESTIGVSFVSAEQACTNIREEVQGDVDDVVSQGRQRWNNEILSSIQIDVQENTTRSTMLYTSLYYTSLVPSDRQGEIPPEFGTWPADEPIYDDFYTIWDIFRSSTPLFHLLWTSRYVDIVRSLINVFSYADGWMPDGRSSNYNGRVQGGSNADVVLGDAFSKGLSEVSSIPWEARGYPALLQDAEVVPPNTGDPDSPESSTKEGRGALPEWINLGWITRNYTRSVSRAVEYSYNDFGVYLVANGLGRTEDAQKYLNRSGQWANMWNSNLTYQGFSGFMCPRDANGAWNTNGYNINSAGYWGDDTYEASPWEYSFSLPHDIAKLITLMGGDDNFVSRLDTTFQLGLNNVGNEPSFLTPFLYNYVNGKQYKTVNVTRSIVNRYFGISSSGLPGNSDAGSMQSYLTWIFMGLYPVTGQPLYLLSSPWFSEMKVRIYTNTVGANAEDHPATLTIRANNLSSTSYFVQSVTLDGNKIDRSWITHDEIKRGGTLEFELGPDPVPWDQGELPPSVSTGGYTA